MQLLIHTIRALNHVVNEDLFDTPISSFPATVCPDAHRDEVHEQLEQLEFVPRDERAAGGHPIQVNGRKRAAVTRAARQYRAAEIDWQILTALTERPNQDGSFDELIGRKINGLPVTEDEAHAAVFRLADENYLEALPSLGGPPIQPAILPRGRHLVANDLTAVVLGSVEVPRPSVDRSIRGNHYTMNNSGTISAAAMGPGSQAHGQQVNGGTDLAFRLAGLREALRAEEDGNDADAVRDLLTRVDAIEERAEDEGGVPATTLERFRDKVVDVLAEESAQRLLPILSSVYVLFGLPPLTA